MQICHTCTANIYRQKKIGIIKEHTTKQTQFHQVWLLFKEELLQEAGPPSLSLSGSDPAVCADTLRSRRSRTRSAVLLRVCWTMEDTHKKHTRQRKQVLLGNDADAECGAQGFQTAPHILTSAQKEAKRLFLEF